MPEDKAAGDVQPGLLTEYLTAETGFFVRSAREFERFQSPFQAVEVHDTVPFGTLFGLDGHFMTSEKDELFYHENLVHTVSIAHPATKKALIIVGRDGGLLEDRRRHPASMRMTSDMLD